MTYIAKGQVEKAYMSNTLTNPLSLTQKIKKLPKDDLRN